MGGQTSKSRHQETPGESDENYQKETKADFGQGPAKDFESKLSLGPSSKEKCSRHDPAQQRDKCEKKAAEQERSLPEPQEMNSEANPTRNGSSAGTPFHIDDVNAGAVILTLITDICKQARKPSIKEREQLRTIFDQMPYLLTPEAREQEGDELVLAVQFLTTVYDHPESANWGSIDSFDDLQLALGNLEKFGSRAEAEPREGPEGVFIV
jgi:hypothetical protein